MHAQMILDNYAFSNTISFNVFSSHAECSINHKIPDDFSGVVASVNDGMTISHNDLFTFQDESFVYCAPTTNGSPINITITFPEAFILLQVGIRGNDRIFPLSNEYVSSFSLSYASNGTFTPYIRDIGSVVCIYI